MEEKFKWKYVEPQVAKDILSKRDHLHLNFDEDLETCEKAVEFLMNEHPYLKDFRNKFMILGGFFFKYNEDYKDFPFYNDLKQDQGIDIFVDDIIPAMFLPETQLHYSYTDASGTFHKVWKGKVGSISDSNGFKWNVYLLYSYTARGEDILSNFDLEPCKIAYLPFYKSLNGEKRMFFMSNIFESQISSLKEIESLGEAKFTRFLKLWYKGIFPFTAP